MDDKAKKEMRRLVFTTMGKITSFAHRNGMEVYRAMGLFAEIFHDAFEWDWSGYEYKEGDEDRWL